MPNVARIATCPGRPSSTPGLATTTRKPKASACPATIAAIAQGSGRPPSSTASAPSTYMTGLRKNVKLIANRSRQPAVRSSDGIGSIP